MNARRVIGMFGCVAVAAMVSGSLAGATRLRSTDPVDMVQRAKGAAMREPFTGVVEMTWSDAAGEHSTRIGIASDGSGMQAGSVSVGPTGYRDSNTGVWFKALGADASTSPSPDSKYVLSFRVGPTVAGRSTSVIDATIDGSIRERWTVDDQSQMLLARETYDTSGQLVRRMQIVNLSVNATPPTTSTTTGFGGSAPVQAARVRETPKPFVAPNAMLLGYRAIGRYQLGNGALQVLYSDGLRDISIFQQRGTLDAQGLPEGSARTNVGDIAVSQWTAAGASTWAWDRNGVVFTMVSDAPPEELRMMVEQLRPAKPSWWNRFRGWVHSWFA
ncbi:MAG: hypothetical protein ACOYN3_06255 [Acidimicrobiia bacterium]